MQYLHGIGFSIVIANCGDAFKPFDFNYNG
jgi:hypothetical protein